MTTTPRYHFEPPPQLFVGVDYRWDPLYFRIPSPRGPLTSTRGESNKQLQTMDTSPSIVRQLQALDDGDKIPQWASHKKGMSCSRIRRPDQRHKFTDKKGESPSAPNGEFSRRDAPNSAVERHRELVPPRMSSKESLRHPPSSASRATHTKKDGLAGHRETVPPHSNGGMIQSPRLTRSAILRRDFNASDELERKPIVSPREANRFFFDSKRKSLEGPFARASISKSSGFSLQHPIRTDTALCHSNYRTGLGDAPVSPRGTKSATLRAAHTWSKLDGLTVTLVSVESPRQTVRTKRVTRAPLSTVDRDLNWDVQHPQRRGIPPIPELRDILLPSREAMNTATKGDIGKKENDGGFPNVVLVSTAQLIQQKACNQVVAQDSLPAHPVSNQQDISHESREDSPLLITMEDVQSSARSSTNVEEEEEEEGPCVYSTVVNKAVFSLESVEGDHNVGTTSSQYDSMEFVMKNQTFPLHDAEFILNHLSTDVREGTIPPVDVVEAMSSFSSSAFSEETDVTPCSVNADEEDVFTTPPLYWRAETLPMFEVQPMNSPPSEVSAEEDNSSSVETARSKQGGSPLPVSLLPLTSEMELAEQMSSMPLYILIRNATPKVVKTARVTTSNTLRKYMKLRQGVRLHLMGIFFRNWFTWFIRLSEEGYPKTHVVGACSSSFYAAAVGGGDVIASGSQIPSERSVPVVELSLTPGGSQPPVRAAAAEEQMGNTEERKSPTLEACDTPTQVTHPLKEKSPPPLSKRALEEAYRQLWPSEDTVHSHPTVVDRKFSRCRE